MKRRTVLAGFGGFAIAGGVTVGSSAFGQAEATRQITVSTAADDGALLRMVPGSGDYAGFVTGHEDGVVAIDIGAVENGVTDPGAGTNEGAVTAFPNLLQIQNQGTQEVEVSVDVPIDGGINLFPQNGFSSPNSIEELQAPLAVGESTEIGLAVDAGYGTDEIPGTLSETASIEIVINAVTTSS